MTVPIYPSYIDLDPFIDTDRLAALDGFLTERLAHRVRAAADCAFFTGPFLLNADDPHRPGSRIVALSQSRRPENYYDLDDTELWEPSADASEFAPLIDFIATLPFAATARMLIMYDGDGRAVSAHKDHDSPGLCHEFIWFRTNFSKPFYMLNPHTGERRDVTSHAAWFDTVNQFHGADASGGLSFSIRVDGVFSDAFRQQIPFPATNRASAAAVWAVQDQPSRKPPPVAQALWPSFALSRLGDAVRRGHGHAGVEPEERFIFPRQPASE